MPIENMSAERTRAACSVLGAIADALRNAGKLPAGELYAVLMAHGCTHEQFERLIGSMVRVGLVRRDASHMLHWTGPARVD